jgi:hypothetical protein
MGARPGGPAARREPSSEELGLNSEGDLSAVGAAPYLGPLPPLSLGAKRSRGTCSSVSVVPTLFCIRHGVTRAMNPAFSR